MLVTPELTEIIDDLLEKSQEDLIALSKESEKEIANGFADLEKLERQLSNPDIELLMKKFTELIEVK